MYHNEHPLTNHFSAKTEGIRKRKRKGREEKKNQVYCVICGVKLHAANQEGIVCRECKQAHRERERRVHRGTGRGSLPITVRFCLDCSQPYHPDDSSIRHLFHLYRLENSEDQDAEQEAPGKRSPARSLNSSSL